MKNGFFSLWALALLLGLVVGAAASCSSSSGSSSSIHHPLDDDGSPDDDDASPADDDASPDDDNDASPDDDDASPGDDDTSPADDDTSPADDDSSGACCFDGGGCQDLSVDLCIENYGSWMGPGTTCATNPCDDDDDNDDNDDVSPVDDDTLPADDDDLVDDDSTFSCNVDHSASTVGLISCQPGASGGYTLYAPLMTDTVYLVDMFGHQINSWPGQYYPGLVVYLLENGQLLRTGDTLNGNFSAGGQGGVVMLQNWDGTIPWSYRLSTKTVCAHHDVHMLPNGNILMIVWEMKTLAEAVAAGRDPDSMPQGELWSDYYLEITPVGTDQANVVWEWHAWDHLIQDFDATKANYGVVADHPELIDVNYGVPQQTDWMHTNDIDYRADLDQILVSVRDFSEVWMLDHSTTTAQAATHSGGTYGRGGDLLYRWGNPTAYRQTTPAQVFYNQHNGHWVDPGLPGASHVLAFNNGLGRPAGQYSSADEFAPAINADGSYPAPDPTYGPAGLSWTFVDGVPADMFSEYYSSAQRLANGNTLICVGDTGVFLEVTPAGSIVWEFINPVTQAGVIQQGQPIPPGFGTPGNATFRAYRYSANYPGLAGQNLTPGVCLAPPC